MFLLQDTFVITDTHIGHANIIEYDNLPFSDVEDMASSILSSWNTVVPKGGTVFHLGDVGRNQQVVHEFLSQCNGTVHLIKGNHDEVLSSKIWATMPRIAKVDKLRRIRVGSKESGEFTEFVLCHYPIESWQKQRHGTYHLHGHSHGNLAHKIPGRVDVREVMRSVGTYGPVSISDVMSFIRAGLPQPGDKPFTPYPDVN